MAKGQCNCGSVAFEIDSDISEVFICHCSICRKSTGSNGVAVVVVDNDVFRWMRGNNMITTWKKPDAEWHASFCGVCGSFLPGTNDESRMYVPAGLVTEGGESLKVAHHIWVESKAVWDEIGDSGKQHLQSFEG
ncbi:GFA family protein [Thermodesulfobacteriota bacterium]